MFKLTKKQRSEAAKKAAQTRADNKARDEQEERTREAMPDQLEARLMPNQNVKPKE